MLKRLKFIFSAMVEIIRATKDYNCTEPLIVLTRQDYETMMDDHDRLRAEKRLMYQCIDCMVMGGTPCQFCDDYGECEHAKKNEPIPGCDAWELVELQKEVLPHEPAAAEATAEANS